MKIQILSLGIALCMALSLPFTASAQNPGGVSTNLVLWNKANTGVTVSGSTVTGWTDQKATNTFTVVGSPTLDSSRLNYNPAIIQTGSSRFTGNTSITFTHVLSVGYIENSVGTSSSGALLGVTGTTGQYFFHTNGNPRHFSSSDGTNTTDLSGLGSNSIAYQILSEDLGRTPASSDVIRTNGLDRSNSGGDPASFSGTPVIGARNTENLRNTSGLVETIVYSSSLSAANLKKVETYLGIKYGFTLSNSGGGTNGDYVSSGGTTIWSASTGSAYHNNVIGIGSDNTGSGLIQKQSHQPDDVTRIYIGTLANNNIQNSSTFSSDGQFVMVGDNAATVAPNASNTEYPSGVGILNRIDREWKVTNTAFAGTFSMDITPSSGFNPACVRLLVDDDGNFSNGGTIMYAPTVTYAGGVITVSGITTQMISTNSTKYVTLAIVPLPGGVGAQTLWLRADAGITQASGAVSQWDDVSGDTINLVQATSTKQPTLTTDTLNYYPVPAFDAVDDNLNDATVAFNALLNVTTGSSTNTTGSMFTVGKVKSFTTERDLMYQWNTASNSNFYSASLVNTGGSAGIGGRTFGNAAGVIPLPNLNPYMVSGLETPGANNALHYLNGGKEKISTIATVGVNGGAAGQYLRVGEKINGYVAEAITYRTKLTDLQRRQVESYLALKYAITLDTTTNGNGSTVYGDYISSDGTTTCWDASTNYAYHHNVIGIGRDDSTALNQKQSHQLDDSVRLYIGTLAATNAANASSFSSDKQFVIMGDNSGALSNTGSTEYPAGISSRLTREWKVTNTGFTGTYSIDIKATTACPNTSLFRLLVDADGNFSSGAVTYSSADGLTFTVSGGVITIGGITTSILGLNGTGYITLGTATLTAGTPASNQTIFSGSSPADLTLSGSTGTITKWQYSSDNFSSDVNDIASSTSATLTAAQMGALTANRYYRAVVQNGFCATANSSSVFIKVVSSAPGGVNTNLQLWNKANAGVSTSGSNVTGWTDQTAGNVFSIVGTPTLQSSALNYNPTVAFNGSSRFEGNTSIPTITQGFAVGKIVNASGASGSGALIGITTNNMTNYFYHTEGGRLYVGGSSSNVYTSFTSTNTIPYSLLSEDMGKTPAANDMIRLNGQDKTNAAGSDPSVYTGIPTLGSRGTENLLNGSELAEAILYNTSLNAANTNKIESYLALKYGITLSNSAGGTNGDYTSSTATLVWDASDGSTYHNNVIGIGRDDSTSLYQKQSHQTDDATRIYIGTLAASNAANSGTFSTDKQFVVMGNNAAALSNTGSTEYPAGISARVTREWKVTNTNFPGTFSIDVTSSFCSSSVNEYRLLVDADGDFSSGATVYSSANGLTFTYNSGVVTIGGITTSMIASNSTKYITLATASMSGGTVSSAQTICINNSPSDLSISSNGGTVSKWQYSSDNFSSDVNDIASSNTTTLTTAQMGALTANRYYRAVVVDGLCATANSASALITVSNTSTWLGTTSSDWNTAANWSCNYVPLIITDIIIPVTAHNPVLSSGATGTVENVVINSGATLTISNKTLQIAGAISNSGSFDASAGTIELKGSSAQTIAGSMFVDRTIENLIITNTSASVSSTTNDTLKIVQTLSFGNINSATFNTGDNLTLLSSCGTGITANVADITNGGTNSGNSINGKVIVERCIPSHRAWRYLTAPVSSTGAPTISQAWQEGGVDETLGQRNNPHPGYGTHITGGPTRNASGIGNTNGNGFDAGPNSSSLLYFENGLWTTPANTSSTLITDRRDYMTFVRGNRTVDLRQATYAAASETILRSKGNLIQNKVTYNFSGGTGVKPVGNPYASTIKFGTTIKSSSVSDYYYTWDPLMTGGFGVGAFITLIPDGNGHFVAVPDPSQITSNNKVAHVVDLDGSIQSGSAFMIYHDGGNDSLIINETDKTGSSNLRLFSRPMAPQSIQTLRTNFYSIDNNVPTLLDGLLSQFNNAYSDGVDMKDVIKMRNIAEYIGWMRNGKQLTAERMAPLNEADTLYMSMTNLKVKDYLFEFMPANINAAGLEAFLEDTYLNKKTPVSLTDNSSIQFTTDNNAASKSTGRFRIVFNRTAVVLPISAVTAGAVVKNNTVVVNWNVINQTGAINYAVEKSTDGTNFTKVATVSSVQNNNAYSWLDTTSLSTNNYYRIVAVDQNGKKLYSNVVKSATIAQQSVKLVGNYDNGKVYYSFDNMPKGVYGVTLLNAIGQQLLSTQIKYEGGVTKIPVQLGTNLPKGTYITKLQLTNGNSKSDRIVIQ